MRKQRHGWIRDRALSLARIAALTGTLTLHIVVFAQLWLNARVVPQQRMRSAITVELYQAEDPPPVQPVAPEQPPPTIDHPMPRVPPRERVAPAEVEPVEAIEEPPLDAVVVEPSLGERIDQQRSAVAAEIARENAPARRLFRGRPIDAMLPDGDKGTLPGFRPRTADDPSKLMRKFGQVLSQNLPSAAWDQDAPMDLLTEGWETKHHGSDLAGCELQYQELDADLRRQMCGEVGRGQ